MYNKPFYIKEPVGNNLFSYERRINKKIYVPNIIEGNFTEIKESNEIAFVEVDDENKEHINYGLEKFIKRENVYLFDNHNHTYFFFKKFLRENNISKIGFIHIDQHKDMREPSIYLEEFKKTKKIDKYKKEFYSCNLEEEYIDFVYTNFELNVGNFIKPLLQEGKISNLEIIDSEYKMEEFKSKKILYDYVLDLDLDFFSEDMDYIDMKKKLFFVKEVAKKAKAIFVATSPYFISFNRAKETFYNIFDLK